MQSSEASTAGSGLSASALGFFGFALVLPWVLPWIQSLEASLQLGHWVAYPFYFLHPELYETILEAIRSFVQPAYLLRSLTLLGLQAILVLGLNLVPGFCGLLDLGYIAFYCFGAYAVAILGNHLGLSFWLALPLATLGSALLGVLRGYPTLKLGGDYYAIVTFGFAELVVLATKNGGKWTGGAAGFSGIHSPVLPGTDLAFHDTWTLGPLVLEPPIQSYYLVLACLALTLLVVVRLRDSRIGRAWFAIREDEIAAESMGVHLGRSKTLVFAISAGIGGLAGGLFAPLIKTLHWTSFQFMESILVLCAIVLGGLGNVRGVLLGCLLLGGLTEVLRPFGEARMIVYGVGMILVMRYRPAGLFPGQTSGRS